MSDKSKVYIFIDDDTIPVAEVFTPVSFELDTHKLVDGPHRLRIVGKDPSGKEGVKVIPFEVRNGPAIDVVGIKKDAVVDGRVPIMINAYGKGNQSLFLIEGSETPQGIPWWVWLLIIGFSGWALYYFIMYIDLV